MIDRMPVLAGAFLACAWGVAHLFPTRSVVRGFGAVSVDNRRIITMEWITEGVALIFIGLLVAAVTLADRGGAAARIVCWLSIAELNVLSLVSLGTGFKVNFLPFKLCPLIFTGSSVLILLGIWQ